MAIEVGDRLPEARFLEKGREGIAAVPAGEVFAGRRVVLFGLPGAFTGMCSTQHVPSFIRVADRLRAKGVDQIVCVAVNDPQVMAAWSEATGAGAAGIRMLADADGSFTRAMGLEFRQPGEGALRAVEALFAAGRGRGGQGAEPRDEPHRLRDERRGDDAGGGLRRAPRWQWFTAIC